MAQHTFKAKIVPASGGMPIEVSVQANDMFQAKKLIEQLYKPKSWWSQVIKVK